MKQAIWLHPRGDMVRAFAEAPQADEILRRIGRRFAELEGRRAMNLDTYQQQAGRTDPHPQGSRDAIANHALGLAGETGELVDQLKKHLFHGHPLDRQRAAKELGDVLWYVARMAWCLGFNLSEIATLNLHKLQVRYPDGFSEERSRNRAEGPGDSAHAPRSDAGQGVGSGPDPIADSAGSQAARGENDR